MNRLSGNPRQPAAASGPQGATGRATPLHLVLMAGQSNMLGVRTELDDLPPEWQAPVPGAEIWHDGGWLPLAPGAGYQARGWGPELALARGYAATAGGVLGIVKVSRVGSSLGRNWNPTLRGRLFDRLVETARAAMASRPVVLHGLLWMQGEADGIDADDAANYRDLFGGFVADLRTALGAPAMPVVSGIVNPPLDRSPHREAVRAALREPGIEAYATVDCDDLPLRRDKLHLTPNGLRRLGRRFASALAHLRNDLAAPAPVRRWIWCSDQYHAWYEGPDTDPAQVVVSLPYAFGGSGFEQPAFGQPVFAKRGIAAVYVRANTSNWFQCDEAMPMIDAVGRFLGRRPRVVTYGASMGGYGALLFSGPLRADKVLAVAPQYSLDRATVPTETRWKQAMARIGTYRHRLEDTMARGIPKYVLYDPLSQDRAQIAKFGEDPGWRWVRLPLASHQVLGHLLETDALRLVLQDLFDDGPDARSIRQASRAARRGSKTYWIALAERALRRRPRLAARAIDEFEALGGSKKKIKTLRRQLPEVQEADHDRGAPAAG